LGIPTTAPSPLARWSCAAASAPPAPGQAWGDASTPRRAPPPRGGIASAQGEVGLGPVRACAGLRPQPCPSARRAVGKRVPCTLGTHHQQLKDLVVVHLLVSQVGDVVAVVFAQLLQAELAVAVRVDVLPDQIVLGRRHGRAHGVQDALELGLRRRGGISGPLTNACGAA